MQYLVINISLLTDWGHGIRWQTYYILNRFLRSVQILLQPVTEHAQGAHKAPARWMYLIEPSCRVVRFPVLLWP